MVSFAGTMIPGFLKIFQNSEILYFIVTVTIKVATITPELDIMMYHCLLHAFILCVHAFPSASICEEDVTSANAASSTVRRSNDRKCR